MNTNNGLRKGRIKAKQVAWMFPWLDSTYVNEAIKEFASLKSPGPDLIKPIMLKHLPTNFISALTQLYKAMCSIGYTPEQWRKNRLVFIPKPNKTTTRSPEHIGQSLSAAFSSKHMRDSCSGGVRSPFS